MRVADRFGEMNAAGRRLAAKMGERAVKLRHAMVTAPNERTVMDKRGLAGTGALVLV
ncbi:hypothetical protein [Rhizobium sp. WYCCWR10014]|uniref:hypothetical protein n=1 Tax=Rhizobium sp. WYCCWR10014 TaxID=1825933 RepID=UPI0012E7A256|nr:hypothetical protein [Rhizobium sp. WYCCWR10014]